MITPSINLSSLSRPFLNFKTSTAFADNSKLEILYSTDFNGSLSQIKKSTWTEIEARIASDDDNDLIWIDSGAIVLDSHQESIHFAFRYTGSGKTAQDGTFELDDIRIFDKN